jgi:exosortase/archaeosortase family protein
MSFLPFRAGRHSNSSGESPGSGAVRIGVGRPLRIGIAIVVVLACAFGAVENLAVRSVEASLVSLIITPFLAEPSQPLGDNVLVWTAPGRLEAFRITLECTTLVMLVPLLLIAAAVLVARRIRWRRFLVATGSGTGIVIAVNLVRIGLICWATERWGHGAYEITHTFIGSAIGILGFAGGLIVMLVLLRGRR